MKHFFYPWFWCNEVLGCCCRGRPSWQIETSASASSQIGGLHAVFANESSKLRAAWQSGCRRSAVPLPLTVGGWRGVKYCVLATRAEGLESMQENCQNSLAHHTARHVHSATDTVLYFALPWPGARFDAFVIAQCQVTRMCSHRTSNTNIGRFLLILQKIAMIQETGVTSSAFT